MPDSPKPQLVPLLPLRDMVVFPSMSVPLYVGRERSIDALEAAMGTDKLILLVGQRDADTDDPGPDDLFTVGTLATIVQLLRLPDGTVKVIVEGQYRARIDEHSSAAQGYAASISGIEQPGGDGIEVEALMRSLKATFETYAKLNEHISADVVRSLQVIDQPGRLADGIAGQVALKAVQQQELLECVSAVTRMERLFELLQGEIEIMQLEKRIRSRVKQQIDRSQKEYYLSEQMSAIQKELGEQDEFKIELQELAESIRNKEVSSEAHDRLHKELRKLKMMAPMSAEATVVRNYVDWVLSLPWGSRTDDELDIDRAARILEQDHYGLQKVKQRIVEHLAVQSLAGKLRGPILCFIGPPGVGKTSLGRSIARATARNFVRLSLGGVRDEAEIRGHRRTYVGALPGRIIQSLKKAGSNNPVFLLDEVDKMSADFRGDPAAALLEVLDPEQNHTFSDHYLELDYDLSDVMFITTANSLHGIPIPLQDRMEIIELPGYTDQEKLQIARRYLIPKQREANGLTDCVLHISDEAIQTIAQDFTKEAGVRDLDRDLAAICRKIALKKVHRPEQRQFRVTAESVARYLGPPKYSRTDQRDKDHIGLANGLAVTTYGGDLLLTEVTVVPGKGKLVLTGKLGDVMQESAHAALSYLRSRAVSLGLELDFFQQVDLHVHCPEGAIPKDGPSAGITMATAMMSALLRIPVRWDVAMTGEITLRGRVLPVGGVRDKLLAAQRWKIPVVLIPERNKDDLKEIPANELSTVRIKTVAHMDDVLRSALRLKDPKRFLAEPSHTVDWRLITQDRRPPATH